MQKKIYIIALIIMVGCINPNPETNAIARVNDNYLYKDDIKDLVLEGLSENDSTLLVNNFINRWATQQLLMDGALLNLSESKQAEFDALVAQYKRDLYTRAYLDGLVNKNLNDSITLEEAEVYYSSNSEAFKLNEELIQFRYINVAKNHQDISEIKQRFKRFDSIDKAYLDSISIQFRTFSLNDSIWVRTSQVLEKVPVLYTIDKNELLKKSNFIELNDSLGLYLMRIKDVLSRNENAPLQYVKPTIDDIVVNKRKLEQIKQLEKDITKDAIKNKQFEIYN